MKKKKEKIQIGWREWGVLPEFCEDKIKLKVDTGARTSALHVTNLKTEEKNGQTFVNFKVHPDQHRSKPVYNCQMPVHEFRKVKSSNGMVSTRPVVITTIQIGNIKWKIELTLVNRDTMSFRMLLGRQSLRNNMVVLPKKSFVLSQEQEEEQGQK